VIAYASRALDAREISYCITRKELLAIVYFLKQFKQYLLGRKFTIRTDHAALTWLRRTPEPIGQNARWLEQMEEYDFQIVHRPSTQHSNADALSRRPCDLRGCVCDQVVLPDRPVAVNRVQTNTFRRGDAELSSLSSASRDDPMNLGYARTKSAPRQSEPVCSLAALGKLGSDERSSGGTEATIEPAQVLNVFVSPFLSSTDAETHDLLSRRFPSQPMFPCMVTVTV